MQVNSALSSGYLGLQKATQQLDSSSNKIAQLATQPDKVEVNNELVNLQQAKEQGNASTKVVKAADEMMGTMIDIRV